MLLGVCCACLSAAIGCIPTSSRMFNPVTAAMSAVEIKHLPGRGRGLVTTRKVKAGEIVLSEEPLLLTVSQEAKEHACANCLCWLERCPGAVVCQSCRQVSFCSPQCQQHAAAKPWVHAEATCRAYSAIPALLPHNLEAQTSLRFLIQAAALKAAAAAAAPPCAEQHSGYSVLMSLVGEPTAAAMQQAVVLQLALCQAIGDVDGRLLSTQEVAALIVKEQLNSYGLLAPLRHQPTEARQRHTQNGVGGDDDGDDDGDVVPNRILRGGAIYPFCALINHECIPNVARFDALDAAVEDNWPAQWPGRGLTPADAGFNAVQGTVASAASSRPGCSTTRVVMRAMHELPAGTEVVQSYFPLNWDYEERQEQAQQVYGFTCSCPRCLLESSPEWQQQQQQDDHDDDRDNSSSGDWETDSAAVDDDEMHDCDQHHHQQQHNEQQAGSSASVQQQQQQGDALDPGYLSVFILKFMCPQEGCCGTMAAVEGTDVCECSVCGFTRTEAEFLEELEQQQQ